MCDSRRVKFRFVVAPILEISVTIIPDACFWDSMGSSGKTPPPLFNSMPSSKNSYKNVTLVVFEGFLKSNETIERNL